METTNEKIIIYQVFTRLFGNDKHTCTPCGTLEQNGCGKFKDFTPKVLKEIKKTGSTHIWYTGVIEHATQTDYSAFNIPSEHPAIVKGKAGSPYAITDYYNVDPDLAINVDKRMSEFEALIDRTHKAGLKMIIDFVPNHVAREYCSRSKPRNVQDLGAKDNTQKAFDPQNNFYYIPGTPLQAQFDLKSTASSPYSENPAKATGNDRFDAYPTINDWYETVKLNYGIDYMGGRSCHFDPMPDTWKKMLHILKFWAKKGIDGFRCDMAEMVPVEFWEYAIAEVKKQFPHLLFIAEVYNPAEYRNYLLRGGFDYLYDKVGLYDTLRGVICGNQTAKAITGCWQQLEGIQHRMLNFLENHDEQRIASDFFAGDPLKALPAMVVSATMHVNPVMIYFGQEFGERGMDAEGFSGRDGRTTIFDYWSVETIRNWRNNGIFDGKKLTDTQLHLQKFYIGLLTLCNKEAAIHSGDFFDLMYVNLANPHFNADRQYTFLRKHKNDLLLVVANFDEDEKEVQVQIPAHVFDHFGIQPLAETKASDLLTGHPETLTLQPDQMTPTTVPGYGAKILKIRTKAK